ncbi:MAG TPA: sugar phosphate isomerase/epimerase family protein [Armatimonadota bacterium]|nr:sugar phosphate isomerase/epimerase family protein [Armatimonadota bacterium]
MRWVLNTYQVAQKWTLDEMLEMAVKTGFDGMEFLMDFEQKHGFEWDTPEDQWQPLKDRVAASGLEISTLTSCLTFHDPDADERATSVKRVKRVIDMAEFMDCAHVRVLGDRLPDDDTREQTIDNIAACIRDLGEYAQPKGIAVSPEMHGSFADPDLSVVLMERVAHDNVGLVFNSQWRGRDGEWGLPEGAPSIAPIYDATAKWYTSVHTHAMEGADVLGYYQELMANLMRDDFQGFVSYEGAYTGPDPETVLRLNTALFRTMTGS